MIHPHATVGGGAKIGSNCILYLAKNHTDFSTSKIGKFIGNKDHATVLHACKTVKGQLEVDKSFSAEVQEIESLLKKRN